MGLRRPGATKDYEEMPGANVPPTQNIGYGAPSGLDPINCLDQGFELASVSVVPDGILNWYLLFERIIAVNIYMFQTHTL